jgi:hypothetical protein
MATTPEPWYVTERSEALAGVLLTSRSDVRIWKKTQLDDRLLFHVAIDMGDPVASATQLFVVQVKGTQSADQNEWAKDADRFFRIPSNVLHLPVCVWVVNVRENKAYFAWVAEPETTERGVKLRFHTTGTFLPLDSAAVGEIIDRVKNWYAVLSGVLQSA